MAAIKATKKVTPAETEKGVLLTPSAKDLKPWYSECTWEPAEEAEDEKWCICPPNRSIHWSQKLSIFKKRDESWKYVHDPLTSITKQLATCPSASTSSSSKAPYRPALPSKTNCDKPPEVQACLSRESTEQECAMELIQQKRHEMEGNATPSTVYNDSGGYGDLYNKRKVEEAHRFRDRCWDGGHHQRNDDDQHKNCSSKKWWYHIPQLCIVCILILYSSTVIYPPPHILIGLNWVRSDSEYKCI